MGPLAAVKDDGNKFDPISSFPLLFHPGSLFSGPNQSQNALEPIDANFLGALNRVGRGGNGIVLQNEQLAGFSLRFEKSFWNCCLLPSHSC